MKVYEVCSTCVNVKYSSFNLPELPVWRLGDHIQVSVLPALVAIAHDKEDGCADNDGYHDNTTDRDNNSQIGRKRLGVILFLRFNWKRRDINF